MSSPEIRVGAPARSADDRGQTSIEFAGTFPLMLLVLVVLWQCALIGYTFSLAGNAADKAVREAAVTDYNWWDGRDRMCEIAGREDLPEQWRDARIDCGLDPDNKDMVEAEVELPIPLLFPGGPSIGFDAELTSAAAREN
ncbi:TadE/TadG family type IV pilus assembly protein [Streptomyces sp. HUAS MG47]|uniref:TadE/TadG family type IV pilus assembly protein n=1 Tax=Streptomyces solicamelliae TaxID=3231716 RepID=UPI003877D7A5